MSGRNLGSGSCGLTASSCLLPLPTPDALPSRPWFSDVDEDQSTQGARPGLCPRMLAWEVVQQVPEGTLTLTCV